MRVSSSMFIAALLSGLAGYGVFDYELATPFQFLSLALTLLFPLMLRTEMRREVRRSFRSTSEDENSDQRTPAGTREPKNPVTASKS